MFDTVLSNATLTQNDETILSLTVAFNAVLGQLIKGEPLDDKIGGKLMSLVKSGELPFHAVTSGNLGPPKKGSSGPSRIGCFPSPDALLSPSYMAHAAKDPNINDLILIDLSLSTKICLLKLLIFEFIIIEFFTNYLN